MTRDKFPTLRSAPALIRFIGVAGVALFLDLWSKWLAFSSSHALVQDLWRDNDGLWFARSRALDIIPHVLRLEVTVNQGAVFGIGQGKRALFLFVSAVAVLFLFYLFATSRARQWFYQILLGLLLAGVLGNVYDRAALGYVRDMIHIFPHVLNPVRGMFPNWQYVFPWIFNFADSYLCVGVGLMLIYTSFAPQPRPDKLKSDDVPARPVA